MFGVEIKRFSQRPLVCDYGSIELNRFVGWDNFYARRMSKIGINRHCQLQFQGTLVQITSVSDIHEKFVLSNRKRKRTHGLVSWSISLNSRI